VKHQRGPSTCHSLTHLIDQFPQTLEQIAAAEHSSIDTLSINNRFANQGAIDPAAPRTTPEDVPNSPAVSELLREASPGSLASSKAAVSVKRKKQQTQQWIILGLLITLAISLTGVLIYILVR
jgi:hypothetical protein